ncbi:MAG: hypothetical protein M1823_005970, partial [Watsoniomyces obsoletus]
TSLSEQLRRKAKSTNKAGDPIVVPSKILAVSEDVTSRDKELGITKIFIAEAAGVVRRVDLNTRDITQVYTGPKAPLPCLALHSPSNTILAGCWDQNIYSWDIPSRRPKKTFRGGHNDFIKTIIICTTTTSSGPHELLISGGADGDIVFWDLQSGDQLHRLRAHSRAVLHLILDPWTDDPSTSLITLFSASSDRTIRKWLIPVPIPSTPSKVLLQDTQEGEEIIMHETSVNVIKIDSDPNGDGDIWTASADKTSKCLLREHGFRREDTKLEHPDFVKDVLLLPGTSWVVTACRDEEVRVWDKGTGDLKYILEGHFDEVTALTVVTRSVTPGTTSSSTARGKKEKVLVSVSLDGTIRQWPLSSFASVGSLTDTSNLNDPPGKKEPDVVSSEGIKSNKQAGRKDAGRKGDGKGTVKMTEEEDKELEDLLASLEEEEGN